MLPRENRLVSGKNFDAVHKTGRFFSFEEIVLKVARNSQKETRIGFSIGLKFSPRAVQRNKARRWLREISKKHLPKIKSGLDVVIMLKKGKDFPTYQQLTQNLEAALRRGNLFIKQ